MPKAYYALDKKFIALIKNIPGQWMPPETVEGEKI
jgi:hypothetical protein